VRNAAVDWVRSRTGRRRLFGVIKSLPSFDRRVFELFYWEGLLPTDIAALLAESEPDLPAVFDALSRIEAQLTVRHRAELMSLTARRQASVSLDAAPEDQEVPIPARDIDPEMRTRIVELQRGLDAALRHLPAEDAAIVRLRFCEGLGLRDVQRALHLTALSDTRVAEILARLRAAMALSLSGTRRTDVQT
jgi:DNA-directed RNA polymerase specialized sigma24 family protein